MPPNSKAVVSNATIVIGLPSKLVRNSKPPDEGVLLFGPDSLLKQVSLSQDVQGRNKHDVILRALA